MRAGPSDTTQSHAINLDDLTTRLENISPSPPSLASTEGSDEEECYRLDLEEETECYNTLVNEGGRPSHPVSLGRDVLENPEDYGEILSYWDSGRCDCQVFRQQMGVWREFRAYQQHTREEGRFPRYYQRVQKRLAKYGFERPFQLDEHLDRQDKLATWIEFLNYEYQDYDKDMRFVERHQPEFDEAWQVLVDAQILRPFETQEFICNIKSAFQHADEEERAEKAVESAKLAVTSVHNAIADPSRSSLSQREPRQRLAAAQSRLDEAIKSLESIKRRNDLVDKFFQKTAISQVVNGRLTKNYQSVKENAERREILLRWMLKQIPLIELEMNSANIAEGASTGVRGRLGLKRNRTVDLDEGRLSKRQRQDGESNPTSPRRTRASTTKDRESQLKLSCYDPFNEGLPSKRPEYNGRSHILSLNGTSQAVDSASIIKPLSTQLPTSQDSAAPTARYAPARSVGHPVRKKMKSQAKAPLNVLVDGKTRVMKRESGGENSANGSTSALSLRRSTRTRKPPERFQ